MSYDPMEEIRYLERMSARPRWSTVLLFGAFLGLLLVVLGLWVTEAEGQAKLPGVGLPGLPRADFSFSWCEQKRPPGRQATCTSEAPPTFDCRLCPSNGWLGYYAEFFPRTEAMLRGCWEQNLWGTRQTHSGVYTMPEFGWAEVSTPRAHEWYRRCWYEGGTVEGGTAATPILINLDTLRFNTDRIDCMKTLGAWPAAGATGSYLGFDPNHPADICANRFPPPGARPLWPVWVRNDLPADHPVNTGSAPPPVPPPPPVPVPPPPEPPPPACEPLATSEFARLCAAREQTLEQCERTASRPEASGRLAQAWSRVCKKEPPPPACEECEVGGYRDPRCAECPCPPELVDAGLPLQSQPGRFCTPVEPEPPPAELCPRFRVVVTPEVVTLPRYVPGIPSTGKLEIGLELRPEGEGPCPSS